MAIFRHFVSKGKMLKNDQFGGRKGRCQKDFKDQKDYCLTDVYKG